LLFIGNGLVTWALKFISSGLTAIIAALVPLFIVVFTAIGTVTVREITGLTFEFTKTA
jgi:drug/metabolite transporter (DMT)-like permease